MVLSTNTPNRAPAAGLGEPIAGLPIASRGPDTPTCSPPPPAALLPHQAQAQCLPPGNSTFVCFDNATTSACYSVGMQAIDFDGAQQACGSMAGNLVMYNNAAEQLLVENYFFFSGGRRSRRAGRPGWCWLLLLLRRRRLRLRLLHLVRRGRQQTMMLRC